jgi:hypothetical protein
MQVSTELLTLTLLWSLTAAQPVAAQTASQKLRQNEERSVYDVPGIARYGPLSFLLESRAEIMSQTASAAADSNTTLIGRWIGALARQLQLRAHGPILATAPIS